MKKKTILGGALALALLCGCGGGEAEVRDPYEGMVQVDSGYGTKMWVELYEDVPVSAFRAEDFSSSGGRVAYTGTEYAASTGVDVSEHQGVIDWGAAAADGVGFAVIRAGYRGYSQGGLFVDDHFHENMDGALSNGLDIGIYFFSQATTAGEAEEEAEFLLELLEPYGPETLSLPVFYDWEAIVNDEARTDGMSGEAITECALAFCRTVQEAGYTPGVYAYRNLGYYSYDLSRIREYSLWVGALGGSPDFYYAHELWQYSATGRVAGIDGEVDLNLWFREGGAVSAGETEMVWNTDADTGGLKVLPIFGGN